MIVSRRRFLGLLAAPAIVRATSIMPVRAFASRSLLDELLACAGFSQRQTYVLQTIIEYGETEASGLLLDPAVLATYMKRYDIFRSVQLDTDDELRSRIEFPA